MTAGRGRGWTHPDADELIVQYDPGQQVHAAHVDGEQGQRVGGHEYTERVYVQVVGEHPEHAEHAAPREEVGGGEAAVPEVAHALSEYVGGRLIVGTAQLTEKIQREEQHRPVGAEPRSEKRRVVRHQLQHTLRTRPSHTHFVYASQVLLDCFVLKPPPGRRSLKTLHGQGQTKLFRQQASRRICYRHCRTVPGHFTERSAGQSP